MPYYHACPLCGCNLDPGEVCDCKREGSEPGTDTGQQTKDREEGAALLTARAS